jgi:hypothetical protein
MKPYYNLSKSNGHIFGESTYVVNIGNYRATSSLYDRDPWTITNFIRLDIQGSRGSKSSLWLRRAKIATQYMLHTKNVHVISLPLHKHLRL